jgi:hypothetical protein
MNGGGQKANRRLRQLIVDTLAESVADAADPPALSTMAWNHCPRSLEYAIQEERRSRHLSSRLSHRLIVSLI